MIPTGLRLPTGMGLQHALGKGVGGPWSANENFLRAQFAASKDLDTPYSLAEMSSPPTVTVTNDPTTPSGLTVAYTYAGASAVPQYKGAGNLANGNFRKFPVVTTGGANNLGDGTNGVTWQVSVRSSSSKVAFYLGSSSTIKYRFRVRTPGGVDQYVSKAGHLLTTTGFIVLDFGTDADRIITVEGEQNHQFRAINVKTGFTASAPTDRSQNIVLFLGDSITSGSSGTAGMQKHDGGCNVAGTILGFDNIWLSGLGSTGYSSTNGGALYNLAQRVSADVSRAIANGTVVKVIVEVGLNDSGLDVTADANTVFDTIRSLLPTASVTVLGRLDKEAAPGGSGATQATYAPIKAAIKAAIAGRGGFHFVDTEGFDYGATVGEGGDGTHPDTTHHITVLGPKIASWERQALGLAA